MHDIAIIGAGPAGATLARLIGRHYRVLLVERRPLDGPDRFGLRKCCGGLLAPDAQAMLSRLGLGLPKSVLQEPQLSAQVGRDLQPHAPSCDYAAGHRQGRSVTKLRSDDGASVSLILFDARRPTVVALGECGGDLDRLLPGDADGDPVVAQKAAERRGAGGVGLE